MTRLSAYLTYLFPTGALMLLINIIHDAIFGIDSAPECITMIAILGVVYTFYISKFRRVYFQNSLIYTYNLFSQKPLILTRESIISIRLIAYNLPLIYVVFYYNEARHKKYLIFLRNMFCENFKEIVEEFYVD